MLILIGRGKVSEMDYTNVGALPTVAELLKFLRKE